MLVWLGVVVRGFLERHIVADDPCPEYSRLDRLDGLPRCPRVLSDQGEPSVDRVVAK